MDNTRSISIPAIDTIAVGARDAAWLSADGEISTLSLDRAAMQLHKQTVLCCYAPYIRQRLNMHEFYTLDVMELFAFVHPATFCIPTPQGLCHALNLPIPDSLDDVPFSLLEATKILLDHIRYDALEAKAPATDIARAMGLSGKGWGWTPFILSALGEDYIAAEPVNIRPLLKSLKSMEEWEDTPPKPPHSHHGVNAEEAQQRLEDLLNNGASKTEIRPQQKEFASHIAQCFDPPAPDDAPHICVAEAGTGTGKTLGYLAPASIWAEKNDSAVWVSTYTKNLQRQIDQELDRLYPIRDDKQRNVAIRKGRENYLCLLNLSDHITAMATVHNPQIAIATGLMLRWVAASPDGDLSGGGFPGWLSHMLGYAGTLGLADRRGECIFSACDHYKNCFSERSIRKAKDAKIVIANHALVMIQSALAGAHEGLPDRYIFDEGHHLFSAADSAFSLNLTAQETRDLRRWILGPEGGRRSGRARGLQKRIEDLCTGDDTATALMEDIIMAAHKLTTDGWTSRVKNNMPQGACEEFFHAVTRHVYAREKGDNTPYSLETPLRPVDDNLQDKAKSLAAMLSNLQKPMKKLATLFIDRLHNDTGDDDAMLDTMTRQRIEAVASGLEHRSAMLLQGWIDVLTHMQSDDPIIDQGSAETQNKADARGRAEWMEVTRQDGKSVDVGVFSHWLDPMKPFAQIITPHLHGMAVTSATLRDHSVSEQDDAHLNSHDDSWKNAFSLTGAHHLSPDPSLFSAHSPFNYQAQSKVFIINDVNKQDLGQVSAAYQSLFSAANGGGLGLFTAITRLRAVHERIVAPLEDQSIPLYAQHVDSIDTGTLIDMFRFDTRSCMLGTDATRDGVDVPGESLKLLIFDRVPWPRPTILHKARRDYFGGRRYDEMLTRLKLKQAFGRLVRRADDKGVFVMLDSGLPSRLHDAFPPDVEVIKCGLAEACAQIKTFL